MVKTNHTTSNTSSPEYVKRILGGSRKLSNCIPLESSVNAVPCLTRDLYQVEKDPGSRLGRTKGIIQGMTVFILILLSVSAQAQEVTPQAAIAMHGTPKYQENFTHLDYVNPDAPKGGTLKLSAVGTFDSLNPFIVKGTPVSGMKFIGQSLVYDALMEQSTDEPFSMYGLLAETIEKPDDNTWVAFNLRPQARWADGKPVTPEDVIWTFNTKLKHGSPFFKAYYGDVTNVEKTSERRVKFTFKDGNNAELPLILSQIAVLPKHFWEQEGNDFTKTSLDAPLGSGPYRVKSVNAGRSITYERNPDYWGKDLPINKGRFNFDEIRYDYYKDTNVALEAFFAGEYDYRTENTAKLWATGYNTPQVNDGRITKEELQHERPQGIQGFFMNRRREVFQDIAVRKAVALAFDFDWSNKQFAYGTYKRSDSFFENSELAALDGAPQGRVLEILTRYKDQLDEAVFEAKLIPPSTDGSGNNRANLRKAMQLLDAAGYKVGDDKIRTHTETGQRLSFEIIDNNPLFERWVLPFIANLERIGIEASFRVLDPAQYQNRMNEFDYDMTILVMAQSSSPGNEQRDFWASFKADAPGSRNYLGLKDPVIDALIEEIITAPNREELIFRTRALDRVLLAGHYVVPQWHTDHFRVAYWSHIKRPDQTSPLTPGIVETWWTEPKKQ